MVLKILIAFFALRKRSAIVKSICRWRLLNWLIVFWISHFVRGWIFMLSKNWTYFFVFSRARAEKKWSVTFSTANVIGILWLFTRIFEIGGYSPQLDTHKKPTTQTYTICCSIVCCYRTITTSLLVLWMMWAFCVERWVRKKIEFSQHSMHVGNARDFLSRCAKIVLMSVTLIKLDFTVNIYLLSWTIWYGMRQK